MQVRGDPGQSCRLPTAQTRMDLVRRFWGINSLTPTSPALHLLLVMPIAEPAERGTLGQMSGRR